MKDGPPDPGDERVGNGAGDGRVHGSGNGLPHGSLWRRWTDGGIDLHLHRVSEVVPQVSIDRSWPYVHAIPVEGDRPTFEPLRDEAAGGEDRSSEEIPFTFVDGLPRQLLRHVPLVILVSTLVLFVGAEFTPEVGGVSDPIPGIPGTDALLFALFLALVPVLLWLLSTVGVLEYREFPKAVVVYGLVVVLGASASASILLVLFAAQFAIIWFIGSGPQNLDYTPAIVVNFALNAVLATIVFQFLVLVRYFYGLLNAADTYGGRALTYQPFHVGGHGGFRDFGKFATPINVILTIVGLYLVYRLYVVGGRALPEEVSSPSRTRSCFRSGS